MTPDERRRALARLRGDTDSDTTTSHQQSAPECSQPASTGLTLAAGHLSTHLPTTHALVTIRVVLSWNKYILHRYHRIRPTLCLLQLACSDLVVWRMTITITIPVRGSGIASTKPKTHLCLYVSV